MYFMKHWLIFLVSVIIIKDGQTNIMIGNSINFRDLLIQLQPDDTLYLAAGN